MKKIPVTLIFVFYLAGLALGITLAALSSWADLEANFYGFSRQSKTPFQGLSCPVMMTRGETRSVAITFTNTSGQTIKPNIRTEISTRITPETTLDFAELAPGESITIQKTISAKNIDLERFIFVKALVYSVYPMSDTENTCGVYVLPGNGSGAVILAILTGLSLLMNGAGLYFLHKSNLPARKTSPFLFLSALLVFALIFAFLGWWIQTIFTLVVISLTLLIGLGGLVAH